MTPKERSAELLEPAANREGTEIEAAETDLLNKVAYQLFCLGVVPRHEEGGLPLPRPRPNTRVKDLPDIALLGVIQPMDAGRLRITLAQTFEYRGTYTVLSSVPNPPASWSTPYRELARENELAWTTLEELTVAVGAFLNPVLAGKDGVWRPAEWVWT